ncbi:MAG: pantoate--beta-alanine ligase [Rhodothermus sp.]|nr:pantoate--beta-alanine ligase [Rhodothermus sp.]
MEVIRSVRAMQAHADARRREGRRLALVPTMGALHEGHLALVRTARAHADHVTVSIFVNPTQFGPHEDYARYPRQLEQDVAALDALGVDVVFAPTVEEMYPDGPEDNLTWVYVEKLDAHLCGRYRPGHFQGVTTVVAKLFNICKPHVAVFGLKDAQQFQIVRRMIRDLHYDIELIGVPTVREPDGLALSSRNTYLRPEERTQAVVLSQAIEAARRAVEAGEQRPEAIVEAMRQILARAPLARVQYAEVVDAETLQPVTRIQPGQRVLVGVAVFFGDTRLIDNVFVEAPELEG